MDPENQATYDGIAERSGPDPPLLVTKEPVASTTFHDRKPSSDGSEVKK